MKGRNEMERGFSAPDVYLNRIETAVPLNDGHGKFLSFIPQLIPDERASKLVARLASKSQIEHRYTTLTPSSRAEVMDEEGFFRPGDFASTAKRMQKYKEEAFPLAARAIAPLLEGLEPRSISHLIVTSCTGFYAPGLDLEIQSRFGLRTDLERTVIGFMGCYAAFNALKAARHIVRSQPEACVMVVNLELCSLHLQESADPEKILGYMQFADGCAASIVSSRPEGLLLERFQTEVFDEGSDLIQWHVGNHGFEMVLSMDVPGALSKALPVIFPRILSAAERAETRLWAIHPGGRSILDAVQTKLELTESEMSASREVLRNYGNMSSATIMFVLKSLLESHDLSGPGAAMAFGPGMTVEALRFHKARV
jgi:alpha-pyrone synthase